MNGFSNNQVSPEPHSSAIELQEAGDGQKDGEEGEKKEEELPMVSIKELVSWFSLYDLSQLSEYSGFL